MGWRLELMETVADTAGARIVVATLVVLPRRAELTMSDWTSMQSILRVLRRAVVGLQGQLLKIKALLLWRADPSQMWSGAEAGSRAYAAQALEVV